MYFCPLQIFIFIFYHFTKKKASTILLIMQNITSNSKYCCGHNFQTISIVLDVVKINLSSFSGSNISQKKKHLNENDHFNYKKIVLI